MMFKRIKYLFQWGNAWIPQDFHGQSAIKTATKLTKVYPFERVNRTHKPPGEITFFHVALWLELKIFKHVNWILKAMNKRDMNDTQIVVPMPTGREIEREGQHHRF